MREKLDDDMQAILREIASDFAAALPGRVDELDAHLVGWEHGSVACAKDFERSIHTLRGTAGTLGYKKVAELGEQIERRAEQGTPDAARDCRRLLSALRAELERSSIPPIC